jgi:predicted kinase
MKKIIMLAGLPGTGKSFYARKYLKDSIIISSDEIRKEYTKSYSIMLKDMNIVYDEMIKRTNRLLNQNQDITITLDSTFLCDSRRTYFLDKLIGYDYIELIMLKVSLETAFKRNKQRDKTKWVDESIIRKMYERYSYPQKEIQKRFNNIKEINFE